MCSGCPAGKVGHMGVYGSNKKVPNFVIEAAGFRNQIYAKFVKEYGNLSDEDFNHKWKMRYGYLDDAIGSMQSSINKFFGE